MSSNKFETVAAQAWIRGNLRRSGFIHTALGVENQDKAGERIHRLPVPEDFIFPGIGFDLINADDFKVLGHAPIDVPMVWNIVALTREDTPVVAVQIASAIHYVIENQFATVDGTPFGTIVECSRVKPLDYHVPDAEGKRVIHLGGQYEIRATLNY